MSDFVPVKKFMALGLPLSVVATLLLAGCSIDGGVKTTNTPKEAGMTNTNSEFVSVTGSIGSAPVIGSPHGNPPTELFSRDLVPGSGAVVTPTSTLTVNYSLMTWSNGKIADSSWTRGQPAVFPLANVIPGWQIGLPGMKVGGRRLLIIPPSLGYGGNGSGAVAPDETLIFVVDLLAVQ